MRGSGGKGGEGVESEEICVYVRVCVCVELVNDMCESAFEPMGYEGV